MDIISCNKKICQLIAKQFLESLNDDENQELQEWIQASPENELLYNKLVKREWIREYVKKRASIDVKKYVTVYEQELKPKRKISKMCWRCVAAVLVLCIVGMCFWMNVQEKGEICEISQMTIERGK